MLRHLHTFIDYEKLIKRDANQECYRLSKQEIKGNYNNPIIKKAKVKSLSKRGKK